MLIWAGWIVPLLFLEEEEGLLVKLISHIIFLSPFTSDVIRILLWKVSFPVQLANFFVCIMPVALTDDMKPCLKGIPITKIVITQTAIKNDHLNRTYILKV